MNIDVAVRVMDTLSSCDDAVIRCHTEAEDEACREFLNAVGRVWNSLASYSTNGYWGTDTVRLAHIYNIGAYESGNSDMRSAEAEDYVKSILNAQAAEAFYEWGEIANLLNELSMDEDGAVTRQSEEANLTDEEIAMSVMWDLSESKEAVIACFSVAEEVQCRRFLHKVGRNWCAGQSYQRHTEWQQRTTKIVFKYNIARCNTASEDSDDSRYLYNIRKAKDADCFYTWSEIEDMLDEASGKVTALTQVTDDELEIFLFG